MSKTYGDLPNERVSGANGVAYAYRDTGGDQAPLVLLQHFRGNLDSWDPALVDALAAGRQVVTFDNTGVGGGSTGNGRVGDYDEAVAAETTLPARNRPAAATCAHSCLRNVIGAAARWWKEG